MKVSVSYSPPDNSFWQQYTQLWTNSIGRSPFQAPHLLQYYSSQLNEPPAIVQCHIGGELMSATFFKQGKNEVNFLSDLKTDHNSFVIDRRCTPEQIKTFFSLFLAKVQEERWALLLNNQPMWAPYMAFFEEALQESNLFSEHLPYSVCPIIEADSPEDLFDRINSSREFRYRVNRLKNQQQAVFEALTDDLDLDGWIDQFCDAHIRRWDDTPTPSAFRDPERILFYKGCLQAWQKQGILVRFSVRTGDQRIGFVVGLRQEDTIVHHNTTFDPDFKKYSPGIAIIHFMAEWMMAQQMHILDFGDGNESYKYSVANKEHELSRIFISGNSNVSFILKTKLIKSVRNNPKVFEFYRSKVKPVAMQLWRLK
ncbi:MAG: GNAT family N-acetyltransferase [Saprospirales bacterium]|nr:GNAT family N-acetyltransferase [Saprospirales bacterium]